LPVDRINYNRGRIQERKVRALKTIRALIGFGFLICRALIVICWNNLPLYPFGGTDFNDAEITAPQEITGRGQNSQKKYKKDKGF